MERLSVSSSNLASAGYDPATSTLQVEFNNGDIYDYYSVPEYLFTDLINAGSVGSYFSAHIRNNFSFQKV